MRCCPERCRRWLALTLLLGAFTAVAEEASVEVGRQIYRHGILPSGEALTGQAVGDVPLYGEVAACVSCHRRSGYGSGEGGAYVVPIVGPALFRPRQLDRAERFRALYLDVRSAPLQARVQDLRPRPAYDAVSLATVLRQGVDPAGRRLDPLMPRYALSEADVGHLTAYLRTLGAGPDPGVDGERLHLATVIAGDVDAGERQAVIELLQAYVRWKNTDTAGFLARPGHSPWHRDDFVASLREWVLHVWELDGAPSTWPAQLAALYREQPVFAILSGLGAGDWQPVHAFCERSEVPCVFPNLDLPPEVPGDYALYLSPGLLVEGRGLGRFLGRDASAGRILQVAREEYGAAAHGLREVLAGVEERTLGNDEPVTAASWRRLLQETRPAILVLWGSEQDLAGLASAADAIAEIYVSSSLIPEIPESLRAKIRLTHRFALPGKEVPQIHRVRGWLRARGLARTHERLQLDTYFAATLTDHALEHLVGRFSRDFFVESLEDEAEALNPGTYPRLSLGPGQRFASKGCYVVRPAEGGGFEPLSEWIVP